LRVEIKVDLKDRTRRKLSLLEGSHGQAANQPLYSREERRLRRIALARAIEARITRGEFIDMADVARRCVVSRACISKLIWSARDVKVRR
jgi:hypothetical protein